MKLNPKMLIVLAVAPMAPLFLSACGSNAVSAQDAGESLNRAVAAVKLAEKQVGGKAFELDEEGKSGWDVDVVANDQVTEVRVNAEGTKVTNTRSDGRIDAEDRIRVNAATVAMSDALSTAAKQVVGKVRSAELGRFRISTLVWEVELNDGESEATVAVDAAKGSVANVDRD